jgi:hypothetical protein
MPRSKEKVPRFVSEAGAAVRPDPKGACLLCDWNHYVSLRQTFYNYVGSARRLKALRLLPAANGSQTQIPFAAATVRGRVGAIANRSSYRKILGAVYDAR